MLCHYGKEIRRKLLEYQMDPEKVPIESLFFFGEKSNDTLVKYLENNGQAKEIVVVEPFKKLELNPEIENLSEKELASSEYSSCIGSALRSSP